MTKSWINKVNSNLIMLPSPINISYWWNFGSLLGLLLMIQFITLMVEWHWGGFSINNATLTRFFSFHLLTPFLITIFVSMHLLFLHTTGSKNPLGISSNFNKIPFHTYFTYKDIVGFLTLMITLNFIIFQYPYMFSDPTNFTQANPLITPAHIQPEWYFLFAYAILRSIPNKLGGVVALAMSILILYVRKWTKYQYKTTLFYPLNQLFYWTFINTFTMLTFLGAQIIEYPYINISLILSIIYFTYFLAIHIASKFWDSIIQN